MARQGGTSKRTVQDTTETNTRLVREAYAAFDRRDIPTLLDMMAEDIDWSIPGTKEIPHAGVRKGRDQVREFFTIVDQSMELEPFELREFVAQGDKVVVLGHYVGRARATGKGFESDWAMVFTVQNGKIVRFQEYTDTLAQASAFRGL
jgi:uncharacterized protein